MAGTTMEVRLKSGIGERLEALARRTGRSGAALAAEAIEAYVDAGEWQIKAIQRAVEQADGGGPFVSHDDMKRYVRALARGETPAKPGTFSC